MTPSNDTQNRPPLRERLADAASHPLGGLAYALLVALLVGAGLTFAGVATGAHDPDAPAVLHFGLPLVPFIALVAGAPATVTRPFDAPLRWVRRETW